MHSRGLLGPLLGPQRGPDSARCKLLRSGDKSSYWTFEAQNPHWHCHALDSWYILISEVPFLEIARFSAIHFLNLVGGLIIYIYLYSFIYYIFVYIIYIIHSYTIFIYIAVRWHVSIPSIPSASSLHTRRRRWRSMIRPTPKWLRRSWKKAAMLGRSEIRDFDRRKSCFNWAVKLREALNIFECLNLRQRSRLGQHVLGVAVPSLIQTRCAGVVATLHHHNSAVLFSDRIGRMTVRLPMVFCGPNGFRLNSEVVLSVPWLHWTSFGEVTHLLPGKAVWCLELWFTKHCPRSLETRLNISKAFQVYLCTDYFGFVWKLYTL